MAGATQSRASTAASQETLEDVYVVDADVHVHEDPAALAEYADPPWDVGSARDREGRASGTSTCPG